MGDTMVAGTISSLNFRSRGQSTGGDVLPDGRPMDSMDDRGNDSGGPGVEAEIMIVQRRDEA